jgi:hypothetical protein
MQGQVIKVPMIKTGAVGADDISLVTTSTPPSTSQKVSKNHGTRWYKWKIQDCVWEIRFPVAGEIGRHGSDSGRSLPRLNCFLLMLLPGQVSITIIQLTNMKLVAKRKKMLTKGQLLMFFGSMICVFLVVWLCALALNLGTRPHFGPPPLRLNTDRDKLYSIAKHSKASGTPAAGGGMEFTLPRCNNKWWRLELTENTPNGQKFPPKVAVSYKYGQRKHGDGESFQGWGRVSKLELSYLGSVVRRLRAVY